MDYPRILVDNLPLIDAVVRFIARRHRLSDDEADELAAQVRLKLLDNDYEVLRRFQNRSSLKTYLTVVVHRHFLDVRVAAWGRWRPSAEARRLGPLAVLLDQLLTRDGMSLDAAVQVIQSRHGEAVSRHELERIGTQLPDRTRRQFVDDQEVLASIPAAGGGETEAVEAIDAPRSVDAIAHALTAALAGLDAQDRLILKLRFLDGVKVARISTLLGLEQKSLYRRIESVLRTLRRELQIRGVSHEHVSAIIGRDPYDHDVTGVLADSIEKGAHGVRP